MSERDIINISALAMAIIIFIAIQVIILSFEITSEFKNIKDKINELDKVIKEDK